MNSKELMLDNWIEYEGEYHKIWLIRDGEVIFDNIERYVSECDPIKISRKILKNNGFEEIDRFFRLTIQDNNETWIVEVLPAPYGGYFMIDAEHSDGETYKGGIDDMKVVYVHQLQNIMNLLGVPKEIEL